MQRTHGILAAALSGLMTLALSSNASAVTVGAAIDNFVRGGVHANTVQDTTAKLVVKSVSNADFTRKSYIKFDLSDYLVDTDAGATFGLTVDQAVNDGGGGTGVLVDVFALNAPDGGFNWSDTTITFNNAPQNDTSSGTAQFLSNATKVGSFFTLYGTTDTPESVFLPDLDDYLQADGSITFMLAAGENNSGTILVNRRDVIFGSESSSGPQLEFSVIVPEPATAALGLFSLAGLAAATRRRTA